MVVIGGGAGGLAVAAGAASLGAKVALVEKHKLGGDCLWYGCVPSKTLLKSAKVAQAMRSAQRWGLPAHESALNLTAVMQRVAAVIKEIAPNDSPERFRSLGVEVLVGQGAFSDARTFVVGARALSARVFVIATGSRPTVPPITGIDAVPFLTNETLFDLREPVPHLLVVGGGAVGSELAQAFRRLGSAVTVVDVAPQILSYEDGDVAAVVYERLKAEGIEYQLGASIVRIEGARGDLRITLKPSERAEHTLACTHVLLATGRTPNVEDLGLERAGVRLDNGRVVSDSGLRTTNPRIYVCGDVAGGYQFTHLAEHQAGIILRRAIFKLRWAKPSSTLPWCTFTDPELARVGLSEAEARKQHVAHRIYRFPFEELDRGRIDGEPEGFAKLITSPRGKLLGAAIVGARAGELIHEYALALGKHMRASDVSATIHVYPTFAQINRRVADQRLKEGLTPRSKAWLKRIFQLRGV